MVTLTEIVRATTPVFGELECTSERTERNETKLVFVDKDSYNSVMTPTGEVEDREVDMSCIAVVIYLDEKNTISLIEHGYTIFTKANKESILTYTSLIGKKLSGV